MTFICCQMCSEIPNVQCKWCHINLHVHVRSHVKYSIEQPIYIILCLQMLTSEQCDSHEDTIYALEYVCVRATR